jgi:hypothetical protein
MSNKLRSEPSTTPENIILSYDLYTQLLSQKPILRVDMVAPPSHKCNLKTKTSVHLEKTEIHFKNIFCFTCFTVENYDYSTHM